LEKIRGRIWYSLCLIFVAWLLAGIFLSYAKVYPRKYLAFVFLFADFMNTNLYYLLGESFKIFKLSNDPLRYVSFSLLQSFIIPAIIAIAVNTYFDDHRPAVRTAAIIVSTGMLLSLEVLSALIQVITYDGYWILVSLMGYRLLLLSASFIALSCFRRMCER
jgi:hypothetical protein